MVYVGIYGLQINAQPSADPSQEYYPSAGSMLVQRNRLWPGIKIKPCQRVLFVLNLGGQVWLQWTLGFH